MSHLEKLYDSLTPKYAKVEEVYKHNLEKSEEILQKYRLTNSQLGIALGVGVLAAGMDYFLITNPNHLSDKGKIGTKNSLDDHGHERLSESGFLNKIMNNKIRNLIPKDLIRKLEETSKVPYDVKDEEETGVKGLHYVYHRLQSLGHDPILGFFYGVRDILLNQYTVIDNLGNTIVGTKRNKPFQDLGLSIFKAVSLHFRHLKSDACTKMGLPIPFTGLLLKITSGDIDGMNVNEITREMYRKGYNMNHLVTMSLVPMFIEIAIRFLFIVDNLLNGKTIKEAVSLNEDKLSDMLFCAHLIAVSSNSLKVFATGGNFFAYNPTLFLNLTKHGYKQLKSYGKVEQERYNYMKEYYFDKKEKLDKDISLLEKRIFE